MQILAVCGTVSNAKMWNTLILCFVSAAEGSSYKVDLSIIQKRLPVLHKYLNSDTERQLQALYALQALIVKLDQPPSESKLSHSHLDAQHIKYLLETLFYNGCFFLSLIFWVLTMRLKHFHFLNIFADLLRMFFDCLYDEDVISEDAFCKWEVSKDPAEQQGKGVALKSVTAFFTWLREAEEESEDNWRGDKWTHLPTSSEETIVTETITASN